MLIEKTRRGDAKPKPVLAKCRHLVFDKKGGAIPIHNCEYPLKASCLECGGSYCARHIFKHEACDKEREIKRIRGFNFNRINI